jgi:putative phage-type endonuclease
MGVWMNDIEQNTQEWFAIRCGKVTASRIADIIATTKSGYSASRANYEAQLICEILTGKPAESFTNAAMAWGTETEPLARAQYELKTGNMVNQIGFVVHPKIEQAGASPDGLVDNDGLIEIKCPNTSTHLDTLLSQKVPSKYITQMTWQMLCTGRKWCDFVSYDPRLPDNLQLFIQRIELDEEYGKKLESEVKGFLEEVNEKVEKLRKINV